MLQRYKNPLKIFVFLAIAIVVAVSIDYTDTYVADRFHRSLETQQFEMNTPISLDRFIEYYDWDKVCIVVPGRPTPELTSRLGFSYSHKATDATRWSLVFIKADYVIAEIPIDRNQLEPPSELTADYYDRWSTIVSFVPEGDLFRMEIVGD